MPSKEAQRGVRRGPRARALAAAVVACATLLAADAHAAATGYPNAPDPGGREEAIVPVPVPGGRWFGFHEPTIVDKPFGTTLAQLAEAAQKKSELAAGAGSNTLRFTIDWMLVEPAQDVWNEAEWARYQIAYDKLVAQGIRPLITVSTAPAWARRAGAAANCEPVPGTIRGCEYPPRPAMFGEWAEFNVEVARRFPQTAAIELWNEPNLNGFYKPHPQPKQYAKLVAAAYPSIKAQNPNIAVLAGALAPTQTPVKNENGKTIWMPAGAFISKAYRAEPGLVGNMDGLSFHHSSQEFRFGKGSLLGAVMRDLRIARHRYDWRRTPLWITEFGLSTTGGEGVNRRVQSSALLRAFRRTMTMRDVRAFVIHTLINRNELPRDHRAFGYGAVADYDPLVTKPAFCAFAGRLDVPEPYGGCPRIDETIRISACTDDMLALARSASSAGPQARRAYLRKIRRLERDCIPCRDRIALLSSRMRGAKDGRRATLERRLSRLREACACLKDLARLRGRYPNALPTEDLDFHIRYERISRRCEPR